jgi:MFS family permease
MAMQNFTVAMLFEQLKMPLVQAGLILSVAQVGGVCGRVFWGWMADLTANCLLTLIALAAILLAVALACVALGPHWPVAAIAALFFVMGATASGWHGAYLSETARLSPAGKVSMATSGSLLVNNTSAMLTPLAFAGIYAGLQNYAHTFGLLAIPTATALALLLQMRRSAGA